MTDIKTLNDNFRKTFTGGQVLLTAGINAKPTDDVADILSMVRGFNKFTPDNDPYGEHDYKCDKIFWKLDYYDLNNQYLSANPVDPNITNRVLTIMLAEEY